MKSKYFFLVTVALVLFFSGGVYFYYYFFRQVNAKLIEIIPIDAAFIFQINDNETFVKSIKTVSRHINPLFELDAYPGCQFFIDQLPGKYNQVVFSGHENGDTFSILFACKIKKLSFSTLLSKLQIDPKNCSSFENCKIYTYGTHLKRFLFTFYQGVFLASENEILLKKAIAQLKNPKNLTSLQTFEEIFSIAEKNKKQNWLILNNERYFSHFKSYYNEKTDSVITSFFAHIPWAAWQVRFSEMEISFAGYLSVDNYFNNYMSGFDSKYLYFSSLGKKDESIDTESNSMIKYAQSVLPSHNDFEIIIHAAQSEYWNHHFSELGMKKFNATQVKLFAFTFCRSEHPRIVLSNAIIKF